jgi:hypothetical protein
MTNLLPVFLKFDQGEARDDTGKWTTTYHLTSNPKFDLDADRVPTDNTTLGAKDDRGLFVANDPEPWINGYDYVRPYIVELQVPNDAFDNAGAGYSGEQFIPAENFDQVKINRVIPLDAYGREHYQDHGWIESGLGTTFDTDESIPPNPLSRDQPYNPTPLKGYRYTGPDVRDMSTTETNRHKRRWLKYLKEIRGFERGRLKELSVEKSIVLPVFFPVTKANPYHDASGKFTSADKVGSKAPDGAPDLADHVGSLGSPNPYKAGTAMSGSWENGYATAHEMGVDSETGKPMTSPQLITLSQNAIIAANKEILNQNGSHTTDSAYHYGIAQGFKDMADGSPTGRVKRKPGPTFRPDPADAPAITGEKSKWAAGRLKAWGSVVPLMTWDKGSKTKLGLDQVNKMVNHVIATKDPDEWSGLARDCSSCRDKLLRMHNNGYAPGPWDIDDIIPRMTAAQRNLYQYAHDVQNALNTADSDYHLGWSEFRSRLKSQHDPDRLEADIALSRRQLAASRPNNPMLLRGFDDEAKATMERVKAMAPVENYMAKVRADYNPFSFSAKTEDGRYKTPTLSALISVDSLLKIRQDERKASNKPGGPEYDAESSYFSSAQLALNNIRKELEERPDLHPKWIADKAEFLEAKADTMRNRPAIDAFTVRDLYGYYGQADMYRAIADYQEHGGMDHVTDTESRVRSPSTMVESDMGKPIWDAPQVSSPGSEGSTKLDDLYADFDRTKAKATVTRSIAEAIRASYGDDVDEHLIRRAFPMAATRDGTPVPNPADDPRFIIYDQGDGVFGAQEMQYEPGKRRDDYDHDMAAAVAAHDEDAIEHLKHKMYTDLMGSSAKRIAVGGTPLARRLAREAGVSALIAQWAGTSNGQHLSETTFRALAMQRAAEEEFGIADASQWDIIGSPSQRQGIETEVDRDLEENGPMYRAFLRCQYDNTQQFFKRHNITALSLYRGVNGTAEFNHAEQVEGDHFDMDARPLSSWATRPGAAMSFGDGTILSTEVPADRILSTSLTGNGCLHESEVVVIGGNIDVRQYQGDWVSGNIGAVIAQWATNQIQTEWAQDWIGDDTGPVTTDQLNAAWQNYVDEAKSQIVQDFSHEHPELLDDKGNTTEEADEFFDQVLEPGDYSGDIPGYEYIHTAYGKFLDDWNHTTVDEYVKEHPDREQFIDGWADRFRIATSKPLYYGGPLTSQKMVTTAMLDQAWDDETKGIGNLSEPKPSGDQIAGQMPLGNIEYDATDGSPYQIAAQIAPFTSKITHTIEGTVPLSALRKGDVYQVDGSPIMILENPPNGINGPTMRTIQVIDVEGKHRMHLMVHAQDQVHPYIDTATGKTIGGNVQLEPKP